MATDYKKIAEANITKYGTDIGRYGPVLLAHLYSDRTHFIYEILQNAEDAGAKEINFHLFKNRLEVRHDGRLFNNADVQGICGLVEGTKKDDLTQIGKFGIGFKSVYAYTNTPKIYSGDEAFCIENYVLPHDIDGTDIRDNETLFVFPFDHAEVFPEQAFVEIAKRLHDIGARTLLFLNHIEEIVWRLDGEESGNYIRDIETRKSHKKVYVISKVGEQNVIGEEWLVFERPLKLNVSATTKLKVEVAFKIDRDKNDIEIVAPAKDSKLIVFFPTEKPTYLNFLIQGPYKTTPNRENIPLEDDQNKTIVRETGELIAESISLIKKLGYLDVNFLKVLPFDSVHIEGEPIYAAVFERVKAKLLSAEALLPTHDERHTKANDALLAHRKDLTEILDQDDIGLLFSRRNWLSTDITYDRTRELRNYLIEELEIKEIEPEDFARNITSEFIEKKSDEWMIGFYGWLLEPRGLWEDTKGILRTKPIIRLDDNLHIAPYDKDGNIQVYLPTESKSNYKTVKKAYVDSEKSLKFLKDLGLRYPDIFAEIKEFIIPKYQGDKINIDENKYLEDVEKLLLAFDESSDKKQKEVLSQLSEIPFVRATNYITNEDIFAKPTEVYLDNEELRQYFEVGKAYFVSDSIYQKFEVNKLNAFLKAVGVEDKPRRKTEESHYGNRGEYTKDFEYDGLSDNLRLISKNRSLLVWRMLLKSIESFNTQQAEKFFKREECKKYYTLYTVYSDAKFLKTLQESAWLYDKNGEIKKPSEITFSEISDEYEKTNSNVKIIKEKLQFKPDAFDQLPEDSKSKLEIVKDYSTEELKEALDLYKRKAEEKETEQKEYSWIPECQPEDIEKIEFEIVTPKPHELPNLEGQVEHLKNDSTSDDEKSAEEKDETKEDSTKITTKQKKEIGNWGERFVLQDLKNQYKKLGVVEDTEYGFCLEDEKNNTIEVFWLNIKSDSGKGYDFVIRKDGIESEYIEVKSKLKEEEELIEITGTQWEFARKLFNQGEGDKYWICVVPNAGKTTAKFIKKLQNPIKHWKDGKLYAHPIHFKL